jgi:ABC-type molybdate transport system substrate-binding protein
MLKPALEEAVRAFAEREGVILDTSYAGCGHLLAQMRSLKAEKGAGQFPDAFFACDLSFLAEVEAWFESGKVVSGNDVVLVAPGASARGEAPPIKTLADLAQDELRVGLAHPTKSALGKLTEELLHKAGLYDSVYSPKRRHPVVHTDAAHLLINQMRAGALDAALVYRSNVLSAAKEGRNDLEIIELSPGGVQARQPFAIARSTRHKYLMRRLLAALTGPESVARFRRLGFDVLEPEARARE